MMSPALSVDSAYDRNPKHTLLPFRPPKTTRHKIWRIPITKRAAGWAGTRSILGDENKSPFKYRSNFVLTEENHLEFTEEKVLPETSIA